MSTNSFFTPVQCCANEGSIANRCLDLLDRYFYLGGHKVCILPLEPFDKTRTAVVVRAFHAQLMIVTALKIISYALLFPITIPLYLARTCLRLASRLEFSDLEKECAKPLEKIKMSEDIKKQVRAALQTIRRNDSIIDNENVRAMYQSDGCPKIILKKEGLEFKIFEREDLTDLFYRQAVEAFENRLSDRNKYLGYAKVITFNDADQPVTRMIMQQFQIKA